MRGRYKKDVVDALLLPTSCGVFFANHLVSSYVFTLSNFTSTPTPSKNFTRAFLSFFLSLLSLSDSRRDWSYATVGATFPSYLSRCQVCGSSCDTTVESIMSVKRAALPLFSSFPVLFHVLSALWLYFSPLRARRLSFRFHGLVAFIGSNLICLESVHNI